MRFGRRRDASQPSVGHPVLGFWRWWTDFGSAAVTDAVTTGEYGRLPETIGQLVADIHPDLEWELGRGREAQHALIVSSGGVAELRPMAERWLRAAPPTTATWEFHAARQPDPGVLTAKLELDGQNLDLSEAQIAAAVDEDVALIDVTVWHPAFPALDEAHRGQVTFLLLDWLLGEDGVERWIGSVEPASLRPENATSASSLSATVAELAARTTEPSWVLMEGSTPAGARRIATARRPLRWSTSRCWTSTTRSEFPTPMPSPTGCPPRRRSTGSALSRTTSPPPSGSERSSSRTRPVRGAACCTCTATPRIRTSRP